MSSTLSIADKTKLLPLRIVTVIQLSLLYVIGDFLFIIIFYLIIYRGNIVGKSLRNEFPVKTF